MLYLGLDAKYVMDEMQFYEISALMKYSYRKHQAMYESNRLTAYVQAQCHSKHKLKPKDIVEFQWEQTESKEQKKRQKKQRESLTPEAIRAMLERTSKLKENLNIPSYHG